MLLKKFALVLAAVVALTAMGLGPVWAKQVFRVGNALRTS